MSFGGSASGGLSIQSASASTSSAGAAAAKPVVLGKTHFHVKRRGRHTITVRLNHHGRMLVRTHGHLNAEVVITFTRGGKTVSSKTPITLAARHR